MIFHSHCKECGKEIPWGWEFCSLDCEYAEEHRMKKNYNKLKKDLK